VTFTPEVACTQRGVCYVPGPGVVKPVSLLALDIDSEVRIGRPIAGVS
jgi:hypothetical protein